VDASAKLDKTVDIVVILRNPLKSMRNNMRRECVCVSILRVFIGVALSLVQSDWTPSLYDWTLGCVAVPDEEIDEIWSLVPVGTPVEIRP
jgi:hypothetical protein